MADNSSNSVASVAIVVIVIIAAIGIGYYFMKGERMKTTSEPTKVEVNVPTETSATDGAQS